MDFETRPDLNNQDIADVLSPRTNKHGNASPDFLASFRSRRTEMAIPRNSRTLLTESSP